MDTAEKLEFGVADRRMTAWYAVAVAIVYAASFIVPQHALDGSRWSLCVFHNVTGLPCPGCGMTRAFLAIGHGNLASAWRLNALSIPLYAGGLIWLACVCLAPVLGRQPVLPTRVVSRASIGGLIVIAVWWAYRLAALFVGRG